MMKHEFERAAGTKIDNRVYDRIEVDYMNSDGYNRQEWFKKFGNKGIIRCYAAELEEQNDKLNSLARRAIDAWDRCHSLELRDEQDRVKDYDLWGRLMAMWTLACEVLNIDEYGGQEARDKMFMEYVIV